MRSCFTRRGRMKEDMRKVVVIGGTSGIALAIAKAAKESGASVIVASSRAEKVEATKKGLGVDGRAVDLTDEQATAAFFEAVTASLVHDASGKSDYVAYIFQDISEGKRAE